MSRPFDIDLPLERGRLRKLALAAEVIDAVTLELVRQGVKVSAPGLNARPSVNASGMYVWIEQTGTPRPVQVSVDTLNTGLEAVTVSVPPLPERSLRIELAPGPGYVFGSGVTAVRGALLARRGLPREAAAGAEVWIRWIDSEANGTPWADSPVHSRVDAAGDFAAVLRLARGQVPEVNDGLLRARLGVRWRGLTRMSDEFALQPGRVDERAVSFIWNEFVLSS